MKDLKSMTTKQLWAAFQAAYQLTADNLRNMATIWQELRDRGEDMTKTNVPFSDYFPAIASGEVSPQVVLTYSGNYSLLSTMVKLVPEDQAKLVEPGCRIPVVTLNQDGTAYETVMRKPAALRSTEAHQVFGDGRIRTVEEQKKYAPALGQKEPIARPEVAVCPPDLDLFNALTPTQRDQVRRYAETRRPPVPFVDLVVRWAVQHGACRETPSQSRGRRLRATGEFSPIQ